MPGINRNPLAQPFDVDTDAAMVTSSPVAIARSSTAGRESNNSRNGHGSSPNRPTLAAGAGANPPRSHRPRSRGSRQLHHTGNGSGPIPAHSSTPRPSRSRTMSIGSQRAELAIDFIIVGAGITGLATGFALAKSGHRVRIFERNDGIHQRSVGVRIPPNLSKILYEWGLTEELSKASKCLKSAFICLETNEPIGNLEWHGDVIKETGGDFLLMHYDDLYGLLYKLAVTNGVRITYGAQIETVYYDEVKACPTVVLENGTAFRADLVIGADGYNSIVRDVVTGHPDEAVDTGMSYVSIVIPAEQLQDDPDWKKRLLAPEWPIWMGNGRNVLAYPIRNGKELCVHAYHPDRMIQSANPTEDWADFIPTSDVLHGDAHPSIHRIFAAVPEALRVKYLIRDIIEDWVDESGTIMLIGEAAHALMPCTIHNLALAVEDAAVLGVLMSRLRERRQLPQFLEAFQDLRFSRVQQVHQSELNNAALTILEPGEKQDGRNVGMAQSLDRPDDGGAGGDWDDERLRAQWEEISFAFGYNALEAAEEWWIQWGSLDDGARTHGRRESIFCGMESSAFAQVVTTVT